MGWVHAVFFCQRVVKDIALSDSETSEDMIVEDGTPLPDLAKGAVVLFVGNVIVLCTDAARGDVFAAASV